MNKRIILATIAFAIITMTIIIIDYNVRNSKKANASNTVARVERLELPKEDSQQKNEREQYQRELENEWKKFAGRRYKATTLVANFPQHTAFSFDNSGYGKFIVFSTYPGTDVVEDLLIQADIYEVTSDGDYLYLYIDGLRSPAKVEISGNSLYTMEGKRYYIWD